jgi:diguanylate cyclase (GGDEF)-like protein
MLSLRFKILAVAATLILLSQVGTVVTVLVTANRDVSDRARRALEAGSEVVRSSNQSRAVQFGNTVSALAADYGFKRAIGTADTPTIESALTNHARRAGADVALLFDNDGQLIASTQGATKLSARYEQFLDPARENGFGKTALVLDGVACEIITVPVHAPLPLAWLSMGFAVTDSYAQRLRDLTGLHASVLANSGEGPTQVIASSLTGPTRDALAGATTIESLTDPSTINLAGVEHLIIGRSFDADEGALTVLLTNSVADAMAPYRLLQTAAIALGALPLLLALIGAVLLSRTLTRPINKLVDAARRMQAGDYDEPVVINTGDELDQFAEAFNSMQNEIARREERISFQSRHDSLTGLYNRDFALEYLETEISSAHGENSRLAVMVITLNALTEIAETLGHDIADDYIRQAATHLRSYLASPYTLARLEMDSFLAILPGLGSDEATDVADQLVAKLGPDVALPDVTVTVRPGIGIAVYPDHGEHHDQLLHRATIAGSHEDRTEQPIGVYRQGDEEKLLRRMTLLQDLRRATRHQELKLYYQPKISVGDGSICGAEALVRWDHPTFGWLGPNEFIPILEQSGNISILTRWALTTTVRECARWRQDGLDLTLSVNFSAQDLLDNDLPWFVQDVLNQADVAPESLIIEITEEAMVRNFAQATAVLRRLRELGIKISIDDFGTGYSSLAQLKNLPVDEIKIDRSFTSQLPDNAADAAIVRAATDLAHSLGLECVAEGIENGAAFRWIREIGVERAQGFYFSEPLPSEMFGRWAREFTGGSTVETRVLQSS